MRRVGFVLSGLLLLMGLLVVLLGLWAGTRILTVLGWAPVLVGALELRALLRGPRGRRRFS